MAFLGKLIRKTEGLIAGRYKIFVKEDGTGETGTGTELPEGTLYALEAEEGFGVDFTVAVEKTNFGTWVLSYEEASGEEEARPVWSFYTGAYNDGTYRTGTAFVPDTTPQVDVVYTVPGGAGDLMDIKDTGNGLLVTSATIMFLN